MHNIEFVPTTLVRYVADYQLLGDVDATEWMTEVLQSKKGDLSIVDFKVLNATTGVHGIQFVTFTVDMDTPDDVVLNFPDTIVYGRTELNAIVGDSDVEVRWAGSPEEG